MSTITRPVTADDLLDLRVGQRAESPEFWLHTSGGDVERVYPDAGRAPVIENNVNRSIKRTLSGLRLAPSDADAIDPIGDRLAVRWRLEVGDPYDLGVFLFSDIGRERHSYGSTMDAGMFDQLFILDQPRRHSFSARKGANVADLLVSLAAQAGITDTEIDNSDAEIHRPTVWPVGTTSLVVMSELCGRASMYSPYFSNSGTLRCREVPELSVASADHSYPVDATSRVRRDPAPVESDNLLDAPNVYLVVSTSGNGGPIAGSYRIPAEAPHSSANRGFDIVRKIDAQGVASAEQAARMAKAAASTDDATATRVSFSAAPDPRHDTFDVVDFDGVAYREQSWRLTLRAGGPHQHDLRRVWADA